jgi:methylmalonyl-CoA mutase C-terminal domain/subunit
VRIVLAKPGLDGHDRGIKVVAMSLRDAGAEVVYLGLRRTAAEIVSAASQEDADLIGLSVLSGTHLAAARDLLDHLAAAGEQHIPVVVGGTVPPEDVATLLGMGVAAVWPVGSSLDDAVETTLALARAHRIAS